MDIFKEIPRVKGNGNFLDFYGFFELFSLLHLLYVWDAILQNFVSLRSCESSFIVWILAFMTGIF